MHIGRHIAAMEGIGFTFHRAQGLAGQGGAAVVNDEDSGVGVRGGGGVGSGGDGDRSGGCGNGRGDGGVGAVVMALVV